MRRTDRKARLLNNPHTSPHTKSFHPLLSNATTKDSLEADLLKLHRESFHWALACCDSGEDAEDALQETYLKVLDKRARFGGRSSFKTWLFGVLQHTAKEQRRAAQRSRDLLGRYAQEARLKAKSPNPANEILRSRETALLAAELATLPERQRQVLCLVLHGLTIREVAERLGLREGTIRGYYERGKQHLRRKFHVWAYNFVARDTNESSWIRGIRQACRMPHRTMEMMPQFFVQQQKLRLERQFQLLVRREEAIVSINDHFEAGLNAFAEEFVAQVTLVGPPVHEHALHFCLALGIQAAYHLPVGSIVFERPSGSKRIDLWVAPSDISIEVSYQREIPSGKNRPFPQLYGKLLADFNKVASAESRECLVILVVDIHGIAYLRRNSYGLLPLETRSRTRITSAAMIRLSSTAAINALIHGPWAPLETELLWMAASGNWHLLAWRVAPAS